MLPLVAIVGRPNVGKSTLFNRLVGGRTALVADEPGLTRDRHYGEVSHAGRMFSLVDTGGFEPEAETGLEALIANQTRIAIEEADLIIAVMDAREGATATDQQIVATLRRTARPVLHVANKVDGPKQETLASDLYGLGVRQLWNVSAEHGLGLYELLDEIVEQLPPAATPTAMAVEEQDGAIRVALVGRPNAGKSALLNRLVGHERAIVSDTPGTTRDPVDARIETAEGPVILVDTAGLRRKKASGPALERLAALWSLRRITDADVACLLIDAAEGPSVQDAKITNAAFDAGRPLVIVLSKSDLLAPPLPAAQRQLNDQLEDHLAFASFVPTVLLSAKTGRGVHKLLPLVRRAVQNWDLRIGTAELNRLLEQITADHSPPAHHGRQVKLLFISQPQTRPPTFVIHCSRVEGLPTSYRRYVAKRLREQFGFEGTPIRIFFRQRQTRERPGAPRAKVAGKPRKPAAKPRKPAGKTRRKLAGSGRGPARRR